MFYLVLEAKFSAERYSRLFEYTVLKRLWFVKRNIYYCGCGGSFSYTVQDGIFEQNKPQNLQIIWYD